MVGIVLNDNAYEQDIRELLMAFCPGEEIVHEAHPSLRFCVEGILSEDRTEFELCMVFEGGSSFRALAMEALEPEIQAECRAAWESNVLKVNYEDRFICASYGTDRKDSSVGDSDRNPSDQDSHDEAGGRGYTGAGVPLHEADVFYQQREDQSVH